MADLNETSLEDALIDISTFTDDRGLTISVQATKLVVPPQLVFVADRILNSDKRSGTADNDVNAIRNTGVLPGGYTVNHYLNDPDAFFLLTSVTDQGEGLKMFQRTAMETSMEPDFTTGNIRYKARERYQFGLVRLARHLRLTRSLKRKGPKGPFFCLDIALECWSTEKNSPNDRLSGRYEDIRANPFVRGEYHGTNYFFWSR